MADIKSEIMYFDKKGPVNTERTLALASLRAKKLNIQQIVLASHSGNTALKASGIFKSKKVIIITHSTGFREISRQDFDIKIREKLESIPDYHILTTTHAFGGIGRSIRMKLGSYQVDEIIAYTLRTFCQGVKVCCELTVMAADAGLLDMNVEVIAIGGSGSGADTALVIKPAHAQNFLDLKILEIICKPREG
jgi:hypothetical protein